MVSQHQEIQVWLEHLDSAGDHEVIIKMLNIETSHSFTRLRPMCGVFGVPQHALWGLWIACSNVNGQTTEIVHTVCGGTAFAEDTQNDCGDSWSN